MKLHSHPKSVRERARQLDAEGVPRVQICKRLKIARSTLYRWLGPHYTKGVSRPSPHRERVLDLRSKGKSFGTIAYLVGIPKSTVASIIWTHGGDHMKPAHTDQTHLTHVLPGGDERNDLPSYISTDSSGAKVIVSTWVPTDEERLAIANGANIQLEVWGNRTPPVAITTNTDEIISVIPG